MTADFVCLVNYLNQLFLHLPEYFFCPKKHLLYYSKETDFLRFKNFLMLTLSRYVLGMVLLFCASKVYL